MAASNYLGTKAEHDDIRRLEAIEHRHIEMKPDGEREEVRQIFSRKGFEGPDLERAVELITSDRDRWVQTMLSDEYGLPQAARCPWLAAASTLSAFVVCGLVRLMPFLLGMRLCDRGVDVSYRSGVLLDRINEESLVYRFLVAFRFFHLSGWRGCRVAVLPCWLSPKEFFAVSSKKKEGPFQALPLNCKKRRVTLYPPMGGSATVAA